MIIENRIVDGGPELEIPKSLSYGKYVIDRLKRYCADINKIAMIDASTHEKLSYYQLLKEIINIANGLKKMHIGRGDVVAICSENRAELIAVGVAAICVGATISMISAKHTKGEILHSYSIVKPKIVCCSERAIETKLQILREVPCIQHLVQMNGVVNAPDVLSLDDVIVEEENVFNYEPEPVDACEDVAFVIYVAGTTGVPKGVMLTHRNVVYGSQVFDYAKQEQHNVLVTTPWYNLFAFLVNVQFILDGDLLVYMSEFDFEKYLTAMGKYQITKLLADIKIVAVLSKSSIIEKYEVSSVKEIWLATIPVCPASVLIGAKQKFPNCKGIFKAHGLTETSLVVLKESENYDENLVKEGSCGAPLPGISVKVVDVNTGVKLKAYQTGEICIKGPMTMKGFLGNEEATREIYDEEGFLKTGDVGYYDTNGCFYITDVVKEIIIYNGQEVVPSEVESVVMQHGAVSECGVVGARHAALGELPTAFVVRKPGADLSEGQLQDYANARLPPHSQLRGGVILIEEIPKSESGKILRRVLRNLLRDNDKGN